MPPLIPVRRLAWTGSFCCYLCCVWTSAISFFFIFFFIIVPLAQSVWMLWDWTLFKRGFVSCSALFVLWFLVGYQTPRYSR
jgi:hypothetical protein